MKTLRRLLLIAVGLIVFCACTVGPNYKRPDVSQITPDDWRWKTAEPKDTVPKGNWWAVFNDPVLDEIETYAVTGSQNLQAAVARVDRARAAAAMSRSQFFPELSLSPLFKSELTSASQPLPIHLPPPMKLSSVHQNTLSVPLDLSYEVDLWGRVARSFEAKQAEAEAAVADYQNVLLTLTGDVAVDYFIVRSLEREAEALGQTIERRKESVRILNARFRAGAISEVEPSRAQTELSTAEADLADITRQRAETVNALALLCGKPAGSFEIAEHTAAAQPPQVPAGLPSTLLERRPDIAIAERLLAAKSAQIGVAASGYFPVLSLTGRAGYLSDEADRLFSINSGVWSFGPNIIMPLFNAGKTAANVKQAEAAYMEALALYRQAVLTAFKEVEDSLAQVVQRNEQAASVAKAAVSARHAAGLLKVRYEHGALSRLDVLDAEHQALIQERALAKLEGQRFVASVRLIKALGGGW
ncbi:MAG: efflux transporter outer membrane subunit [Candidatus Magnetominusculus sp. LBB02]|nr:efflux transporter outer membrane subunit [Candidatus Magnetominusculus sp. LBB02]